MSKAPVKSKDYLGMGALDSDTQNSIAQVDGRQVARPFQLIPTDQEKPSAK